ncbi:MAG: bifunctional adenosylcobinamide kinase/adenosylcobinamide-phosphate guanylyltransferase [Oscillospiraceae bacterium]|nr:bifunctional adenosylcobinamide kinase/adenosylcobinamide-phosphate guanylyltransferase [Oscillospiraceae bacterium]MBP1560682.1 bifunctional adenosylcobinamide kinase/adenosylcobinamide-phosphate guanylyltransferase [Oscillospiraceae bacterium]
MIMITGGAYEGKTDFVKNHYSCKITDGKSCDFESVFTAECVNNFHILVKRLIESGQDVLAFTERLCKENSDLIVITDEIGCGIIPLEKDDRIWREQTGRAGCIIAKNSDTVVRVFCGIPTLIKGEL